MRLYDLNKEASNEVYACLSDSIKLKKCYTNIFHAVMSAEYFGKFKSGEWKIAYGYFQVTGIGTLYARHCFILDENDKVIDPTLSKVLEEKNERDRYPQYICTAILTLNEYEELIFSNNSLSLDDVFLKEEKELQHDAFDSGIFLIG